MSRGLNQIIFRILPLVLALAGPGCAHFRAEPEPATSPPAKSVKAPKPAAAGKSAPGPKKTKRKTADKKSGKKGGAPENEWKLNPKKVLALQSKELKAQRSQKGSLIQRQNRMTRWLDDAHARCYRWMDNAVRTVDAKWLAEDMAYDPELSTFRLRTLARMGGRSSDEDFDFKVRFRGDLALPALESRVHLILENADKEALPGKDPMGLEDDTRLGLRTIWKTLRNSELEVGGGLKWRDSNPVVYGELEWRMERDWEGWQMRFNPRVHYFSDEGFGQRTALTWSRPVGRRQRFQVVTAERSSEGREGVEFEQSFRFAWLRSGKGRGWVAQASVFPHLTSSDWTWDDSLVNLTWRDALYRKWIYYTITPQVQFPKEDEYEARPSLRIGLEILFGGKIGDLM